MEWFDTGIVLYKKDYNEDICIVSCLMKEHGLRSATVKKNKKTSNFIYPGNIITVLWKARLEEYLGKFSINSSESIYPYIYQNKYKVLAIQSICTLFKECLNEREVQKDLYANLEEFIYLIKFTDNEWLKIICIIRISFVSKIRFWSRYKKVCRNWV